MNRRLFLAAPAALWPAPILAGDDVADIIAHQAQELNDAVTNGAAAVWERYLHDNAVYSDEDGNVSTKAALVAQIQPLPQGVTGVLTTQDFRAHRTGDTVVTNYVIDEHETYHGARLHCQYRNTVTWVSTPAGWRVLAVQSMALRTDPPEITLPAGTLRDYPGTYRLGSDVRYAVTLRDGALHGQQTGGSERPLKAEVADMFFNPGRPRYRFIFMRNAEDHIDRMVERREAWDIVWMREG